MAEYIKKEDTLIELIRYYWGLPLNKSCSFNDILKVVRDIPAADVVDKQSITRGLWMVYYDNDTKENKYVCDQCHKEGKKTDFCNHCGALMDTHSLIIPAQRGKRYSSLYQEEER